MHIDDVEADVWALGGQGAVYFLLLFPHAACALMQWGIGGRVAALFI